MSSRDLRVESKDAGELTQGSVAEGYEAIWEAFERVLRDRGGWNGAIAAYLDGELVVDLWGGPDYRRDSLQVVYSSTKGAAAISLAALTERGLLDPDAPVAEYWPEFADHGKERIPVRWLLSHQAGLVGVDGGFSLNDYLAHTPVAERLAAQRPYWEPGTAHGYHALTYGTLVAELFLRIAGESIGAFFEREIAEKFDVEFYIGLPGSAEDRLVAPNPPPREVIDNQPQSKIGRAALNMDADFPEIGEIAYLRDIRSTCLPAIGGVSSARGMARLYSLCVSDVEGRRLLSPSTVATYAAPQVDGEDLVLGFRTSFALGFQTPSGSRLPLGGEGSFGHDGFGGTLGLASPRHGLALGFTTTQTPSPSGGAELLSMTLAEKIVACAGQ